MLFRLIVYYLSKKINYSAKGFLTRHTNTATLTHAHINTAGKQKQPLKKQETKLQDSSMQIQKKLYSLPVQQKQTTWPSKVIYINNRN